MNDRNLLRLGLTLGMLLTACDDGGDDREGSGNLTGTAATAGSADATSASGAEGDAGSDSSEPGDDSGDPGDGSTSTDPQPDPSAGEDTGADPTTGGGDPSTGVRGAVVRSVAPAPGQDAIGTLYVGLLLECTADSAQAGGATPVMGADLSAEGSQALYEVTGVAPGTYFLVAFLDDNLNADPNAPYADNADLVTANGFAPGCVEVTIVDGQMTTAPAAVNLNLVYPL
ncbi:MAG: hypothetical protein IPH07_12640 [Deltaproteobacteria bacterium]|nr:hypothetical protein [Deltaproteobacteria bacterium]MBK8241364.1 hypothetical protein [Deltaproteobacteria bacterium]MBK8717080.1 hypothetical protein [Deltaproteobacteria bacterium]MBP7286397.1 hypothetical protein [Nannocystaceae bacterium]